MIYQAPELLLGATNYGPAIDMWSAACVMVKLFARVPVFKSKTPLQHLIDISKLCGSIDVDVWPEVDKLERFRLASFLPQKIPRQVSNFKIILRFNLILAYCYLRR